VNTFVILRVNEKTRVLFLTKDEQWIRRRKSLRTGCPATKGEDERNRAVHFAGKFSHWCRNLFAKNWNTWRCSVGTATCSMQRRMALPCINFGMGSDNAALLLIYFLQLNRMQVCLGKWGGLKKKNAIGDLILQVFFFFLPLSRWRKSNAYFPPEVPALPASLYKKAISTTFATYKKDYWTGKLFTPQLAGYGSMMESSKSIKGPSLLAIDMETARFLVSAFTKQNPGWCIVLVSDQPMIPRGEKPEVSDYFTKEWTQHSRNLILKSNWFRTIINKGDTVKASPVLSPDAKASDICGDLQKKIYHSIDLLEGEEPYSLTWWVTTSNIMYYRKPSAFQSNNFIREGTYSTDIRTRHWTTRCFRSYQVIIVKKKRSTEEVGWLGGVLEKHVKTTTYWWVP